MKKSDSIKDLAAALVKFQAEVTDPAKDGKNPHFNSKFVELNDLLSSVRPILTKHGLAVMQEPAGNGTEITVTTILLHESGEWMEFEPLALKAQKTDPQGAGSAITYGRRYALSAVLGVAWDDDDDGNKASGKDDKKGNTPPKQDNNSAPIDSNIATEMQIKKLYALSKEQALSGEDMKQLLQWKYQKSSKELTKQQASEVINKLADIWQEFVADQSAKAG
jgi:hypothetical protein